MPELDMMTFYRSMREKLPIDFDLNKTIGLCTAETFDEPQKLLVGTPKWCADNYAHLKSLNLYGNYNRTKPTSLGGLITFPFRRVQKDTLMLSRVNKPVLQIGVDDLGTGWKATQRPTQRQMEDMLLSMNNETKMIQLQLDGSRWSVGKTNSELTISLNNSDFQPVCKEGESIEIKILDLIIKCKKIRNLYAITEIKNLHGAPFNTLQIPITSTLAKMLCITTLTPVTTYYR